MWGIYPIRQKEAIPPTVPLATVRGAMAAATPTRGREQRSRHCPQWGESSVDGGESSGDEARC